MLLRFLSKLLGLIFIFLLSNKISNQNTQDLPVDPAEAPKPNAPPAKITASANKKVNNPKRVAAGKALAARNNSVYDGIKKYE